MRTVLTHLFTTVCGKLSIGTVSMGVAAVMLLVSPLNTEVATAEPEGIEEAFPLEGPTRITASEGIVVDAGNGEVTANGDVLIERPDFTLTAGTVAYSISTGDALASDDVLMSSEEGEFSASRVEFNLKDETGSFSDGQLFYEKSNLHIRAGEIKKTGENSYQAKDAVATSCDGENPAWELAGRDLEITVGGYGVIHHALFRVKEVPVFYTPYMVFPVILERQSGLLIPSFDYSDRKGLWVSQPFFWAINDSSDATFYVDYMSRRGVKPGIEYRYLLSETDRGVAMFDYLDDRKVDDGTGTSSQDWGYTSDRYLRPDSERYWFRMKHDQSLGEQSTLMLDLDIVSDQDYLYEFRRGSSGYEATEGQFLNVFGRDIDDYNERVRKNRLNFNTQWPGYSLNAEALWWDDIIARTQAETDDTVQSLPVVSLDRYRQPLFGSALYTGFEANAAYLFREDGASGERMDLYPRIYLPYRMGSLLSIEPSLGGRETLWRAESSDGDGEMDETQHRELYDFKLDLSADIYNVFTPGWGEIEAIKHAVKFQVAYEYTPTVEQDAYPYFDGLDRIDGENLITYGFVNTFTTRKGGDEKSIYRQVARIELSQSFDLERERDGDPEPFNPIEADLQLDLSTWGQFQGDAAWSTHTGKFSSHNIAYQVSDARGDWLSLQHRYSESLRETLRGAAALKVTDRIWLFPEYERNIKDDHMVSRGLDLAYRAECWSLEANFEEEYEDDYSTDKHYGLTFTFYGLGGVGSSSEHEEGLPSWAKSGF